jgi:cytochrome c oxidase subunit 2/cytochrome aa3-600 menaquinol oxidase subunit 2
MLIGSIVIFGLVMGLVGLAFVRRGRPGEPRREARFWIVGLGLVFPASVLAALLAYGLVVGERLLPRPDTDVVQVRAEARRFAWSFGYADRPDLTTEGVLHIPAGRAVDVSVTTADVVHSFWVPRLAGKIDAIPGHVNIQRLTADRPGVYAGVSAEFSGPGYASFTFQVIAHDPQGWARFLGGVAP